MKTIFFFILMVIGFLSTSAIAQDQSALRKKQFNLDDILLLMAMIPSLISK